MSKQDTLKQDTLNAAILYALREGCFFPVKVPRVGASTQELIQWGAMRHLHDAIADFFRPPKASPSSAFAVSGGRTRAQAKTPAALTVSAKKAFRVRWNRR